MENLIGKRFGRLVVVSYVGLLGGGQKLKYGIHKGYHTWRRAKKKIKPMMNFLNMSRKLL
jgi:hypothetical protein